MAPAKRAKPTGADKNTPNTMAKDAPRRSNRLIVRGQTQKAADDELRRKAAPKDAQPNLKDQASGGKPLREKPSTSRKAKGRPAVAKPGQRNASTRKRNDSNDSSSSNSDSSSHRSRGQLADSEPQTPSEPPLSPTSELLKQHEGDPRFEGMVFRAYQEFIFEQEAAEDYAELGTEVRDEFEGSRTLTFMVVNVAEELKRHGIKQVQADLQHWGHRFKFRNTKRRAKNSKELTVPSNFPQAVQIALQIFGLCSDIDEKRGLYYGHGMTTRQMVGVLTEAKFRNPEITLG